MKKIDERVLRVDDNYVAEIVVEDEGKKYYVVCQLGDLMYKTFDGSYIDFLSGKAPMPNEIEGDDYLWFDDNSTKFAAFYSEALERASKYQDESERAEKYSNAKVPSGTLKFDILDKQRESCGFVFENEACELKVRLQDGSVLFVYFDDINGDYYAISKETMFQSENPGEPIEVFYAFEDTAESKYYDLYYALERYKDELI